jgi:fatty acid desaturase
VATAEKLRLLEMHRPRWSSLGVWLSFIGLFFLGESLLYGSLVQENYWATFFLILVLAHLMHAHLIAFHESAHGLLCPNQRLNDVLGTFVGLLGFMSLTAYRTIHHTHHAYLATERDEELWPFVIPGTPRWQRWLAAGAELIFGLFYTPLLFVRSFLRQGSPVQVWRVRRRIWVEFVVMTLIWGGIVTAVAVWGLWKFLILMYLIPALLAGFMQSLRKYIEHVGLMGATPIGSTRSIISSGILGRVFSFSLFHEPYHGVHHVYARLPHSYLPRLTSVLTPTSEEELPPFPSYRSALWHMLGTLRDPRVGAQWIRRPEPEKTKARRPILPPNGISTKLVDLRPSGGYAHG